MTEHKRTIHDTPLKSAEVVGYDETGVRHTWEVGSATVEHTVTEDGSERIKVKSRQVMDHRTGWDAQSDTANAEDLLISVAKEWHRTRDLMGGRVTLGAPEQRVYDAVDNLLNGKCQGGNDRGEDVEQCIFVDGVPTYFGNGLWSLHLKWYPPEVLHRMSVAEWSSALYPLTGHLLHESLLKDEELSAWVPRKHGGRRNDDGTVNPYSWPAHVPRETSSRGPAATAMWVDEAAVWADQGVSDLPLPEVSVRVMCKACRGDGEEWHGAVMVPCHKCNGAGSIEVPSVVETFVTTCTTCDNTGIAGVLDGRPVPCRMCDSHAQAVRNPEDSETTTGTPRPDNESEQRA